MPQVATSPQINSQPKIELAPVSGPGKGKRSYISIVIGIAAVVLVVVAIWVGYQALNTGASPVTNPSTTINSGNTVPEIKSDADFQKLEDEVNNQDIDGLTKDLDQNDTDAAQF